MLIVSQDKKCIMNLSQVEIIDIDHYGKPYVFMDMMMGDTPMGIYANVDRCKDVLQELWSAYANGEKVFFMPEN